MSKQEAWEVYRKKLGYFSSGIESVWGAGYDAGAEEAVALLRLLADKCEEVGKASIGVFTVAKVHGAEYTGPHYGDELAAAKRFLDGLSGGTPERKPRCACPPGWPQEGRANLTVWKHTGECPLHDVPIASGVWKDAVDAKPGASG